MQIVKSRDDGDYGGGGIQEMKKKKQQKNGGIGEDLKGQGETKKWTQDEKESSRGSSEKV